MERNLDFVPLPPCAAMLTAEHALSAFRGEVDSALRDIARLVQSEQAAEPAMERAS